MGFDGSQDPSVDEMALPRDVPIDVAVLPTLRPFTSHRKRRPFVGAIVTTGIATCCSNAPSITPSA